MERLRSFLNRAATSVSQQVKQSYLFQVEVGITSLTHQLCLLKLVQNSSNDTRWLAFTNFVSFYSNQLNLNPVPLPLFGESYFSTGSFTFYETLRLSKQYFVLSVSYGDPALFWPLAAHELAHCWLSSRDTVDRISANLPWSSNLRPEVISNRVEEALCDSIATRIMGPSYPFSFINKFWTRFPIQGMTSAIYPTDRYRLECMARVLDESGFFDEAADVRDVSDSAFVEGWQEEEISWSLDSISEQARQVTFPNPRAIRTVPRQGFSSLGMTNLSEANAIFYSSWASIDNDARQITDQQITELSRKLVSALERSPVSSDTKT